MGIKIPCSHFMEISEVKGQSVHGSTCSGCCCLSLFVPPTQLIQRSDGGQVNIQRNVGVGKLMMTNADRYIVLKRNVI